MTLLTAGALTETQLPATATNVCTTDARVGGIGWVPPPQTKILATPVAGHQGSKLRCSAFMEPSRERNRLTNIMAQRNRNKCGNTRNFNASGGGWCSEIYNEKV